MSFGIVAPENVQTRVRSLVDRVGVGKAADELGVGREATARIAAGLGVRRGTLSLVEQSLGVGRRSAPPAKKKAARKEVES